MNKCLILFSAGIIMLIGGCMSCNNEEIDFLGKSRKEIVEKYLATPDVNNPVNNEPAIVIGIGSGYKYFRTPEEILSDKQIMTAPVWRIKFGFKKNFWRTKDYFYELKFEEDKVYQQRIGYISDAI